MSKNDISCQTAHFKEKFAFPQSKTEPQKALFCLHLFFIYN